MFLEPHSQIVAKEVVKAVKMDLSVEKLGSIAEGKSIAQANCVGELGRACERIPASERRGMASRLPVAKENPKRISS